MYPVRYRFSKTKQHIGNANTFYLKYVVNWSYIAMKCSFDTSKKILGAQVFPFQGRADQTFVH